MLNVTYPQNQDVSALVRLMLLSGRDSLTHCYWCPFSLTSESFSSSLILHTTSEVDIWECVHLGDYAVFFQLFLVE